MEILAIVVGLIVIVWVFGFMKSIRKVADMANNEIAVQEALHKNKCVDRLSKMDTKDFAKKHASAKAVVSAMQEFNL